MDKPVAMGKSEFWWVNEWPSILKVKGYNWIDYTLFNIAFRWDKLFAKIDLDFVIFGLGFYASYVYGETETSRELAAQMARIEAGEDICDVFNNKE